MHLNWRLGGSYLQMEVVNWVCFLLCLPSISESCLDGTIDRLISGENYRVPNRLFKADSFDGIFTPKQARLKGFSWCSSNGLIESDRPWLQVTFEMDVNISIIQTGGYGGLIVREFYVTKFEVCVGDSEEDLHSLTISDDSAQRMVFERMGTREVRNTTLPSPVTTKVLRIVAVEWNRDQACLRIEALGCPTHSGVAPTSSPYTTQENIPTEETSEETRQNSPDQSRANAVGGAVGGVLSLLVALLLTIVVAAIFIFRRRRSAQVQLSENHRDSVHHNFDNPIYGDKEFSPEYHHLTRPDIPSICSSNTYESVRSTGTILQEQMQDQIPTEDLHSQQNHRCSGEESNTEYHHLNRPNSHSSCPSNYESAPPTTTISPMQHQDVDPQQTPLYGKLQYLD